MVELEVSRVVSSGVEDDHLETTIWEQKSCYNLYHDMYRKRSLQYTSQIHVEPQDCRHEQTEVEFQKLRVLHRQGEAADRVAGSRDGILGRTSQLCN